MWDTALYGRERPQGLTLGWWCGVQGGQSAGGMLLLTTKKQVISLSSLPSVSPFLLSPFLTPATCHIPVRPISVFLT